MLSVCLAANRVGAEDKSKQDVIEAVLIGAGGQLFRARAVMMFGDGVWARIVEHQHRQGYEDVENDLVCAAAMSGEMRFEGGNEAAHVLVAAAGRAEQRQERLGVGRVARQLEGLLHSIFDGSGCALDGNGKAPAGIRFPACDDGRDDGCKIAVAFSERHRALGLYFKAALLSRSRRRLDDDVVEQMPLTATLELEPIDDGAGKPEGLRLCEQAERIVGCHSCFELRTCRSRRARAGVLLWLCGLRHGWTYYA